MSDIVVVYELDKPVATRSSHKCHGLLVIALTDDRGRLVWVSAARWATALVRAPLVLTNREVAR